MAVYVDDLVEYPQSVIKAPAKLGTFWCHLFCDTGDEDSLHEIARKIGMRREWFQGHNPRFPHYDLVPSRRVLAIRYGATPVNLREWLKARMTK